MKIFSCDHCGHPVFFENVQCLNCGSSLAFLPDQLDLAAVEPVPATEDNPENNLWQRSDARTDATNPERRYRMCSNQLQHQSCNFAVDANDPQALCVSCRQTRLLPDLSVPGNTERWTRIEVAKRRLYYTLAKLGLQSLDTDTNGFNEPVFEFLADLPGAPQVMTGHNNGVITLNVSEADDDERARRRLLLKEPYRTLLGHMRHESGHYYWNRLIIGQGRLYEFRDVFGDDSIDYAQALDTYYNHNGQTDWRDHHVSAYATAHPWEDWAETWAHYLHMVDLLETASAYSTHVVVPGDTSGQPAPISNPFGGAVDFDLLVREWVPVTLLLNSMNRSLGQDDAYPFALADGAMRKLRYVHDVIRGSTQPPACEPQPEAVEPDASEPPDNLDAEVAVDAAQAPHPHSASDP